MNKNKRNDGQRRKPKNPLRFLKFPRYKATQKEFDGTHQSMNEAWRDIELEWRRN